MLEIKFCLTWLHPLCHQSPRFRSNAYRILLGRYQNFKKKTCEVSNECPQSKVIFVGALIFHCFRIISTKSSLGEKQEATLRSCFQTSERVCPSL